MRFKRRSFNRALVASYLLSWEYGDDDPQRPRPSSIMSAHGYDDRLYQFRYASGNLAMPTSSGDGPDSRSQTNRP